MLSFGFIWLENIWFIFLERDECNRISCFSDIDMLIWIFFSGLIV